MLRRSHTTVLERDGTWSGAFETEPCEAGWASEVILFVRTLAATGPVDTLSAKVQISPDGMHWCDEGTEVPLSGGPGVTFGRVSHFGTYLRLAGRLPEGAELRVIVYVALKE